MRTPSRLLVAVLATVTVVSTALADDVRINPRGKKNPIVQAVKKTQPSVVTIRVPRHGMKDMIGTGAIVDESGLIITNRHVVGNSSQVNVTLHDGTPAVGTVVVAETRCDLAVVRVRTERKLQAIVLGPTDLDVGETVIAVGHPYGYTNTVSVGIVSALGREITMPTGDTIPGLIQTDASINPGNSGGPLLNIEGEVIGINVALREGAQGIAFAINMETVKQLLNRHLSAAKIAGVRHGLRCEEKVVAETGDRQRVVVANAATQGLPVQPGDEILAVGDRKVANAFDVERALWRATPGGQVELKVNRQGRELTVTLPLSAVDGAGQVASLQTEGR